MVLGAGGGTIDRPKALMRGRSAKMRLFFLLLLLCLVPWVRKEKKEGGRPWLIRNRYLRPLFCFSLPASKEALFRGNCWWRGATATLDRQYRADNSTQSFLALH